MGDVMQWKTLARRTPLRLAIATIATLGVIAGTAYATVLAPSAGVIRACAADSNGALRAVAAAGRCRRSERALPWNTAGPHGVNGAVGPIGPQGPAGAAGPQGPTGQQGLAGSQGPAGASGSVALGLAYASLSFANPAADQYGVGGVDFGDVPCSAGKKVLGGGVSTSGTDQFLNESFPSTGTGTGTPGSAGWAATVENGGVTDETFTVYAICANG
jgi:hypothetical protein